MNSKKFWVRSFVLLAIIMMIFTGCSDDSETTYTVWVDTIDYPTFFSIFGELEDGYYIRVDITNSEFDAMAPDLTKEYRKKWTEKQIKDWFIGRGFGNNEATRETAWLLTTNHGMIFSRDGSIVDMLIK